MIQAKLSPRGEFMQAEVVVIGSELLLGQIVDTNSATIARELAATGLDLFYKTTVGDNLGRVTATLRMALERSDIVITTGGLGPTADDITREAVAAATDRGLEFVPHLMEQIEAFFRARNLPLSPSNRRQAYIPEGALAVENPVGTAPAFIVEVGEKAVIVLPGVPREMEYLLHGRVIPYLRERFNLKGVITSRILKVCGLGESRVGESLSDFMETGANPTVGTMAHLGQVDIRIAAKAASREEAADLIAPVEEEVRKRLGDHVFGVDGETLEGVVLALLKDKGLTVGVLEVGTGGAVAERLTSLPEAAAVFRGGVVAASIKAVPALGLGTPDGPLSLAHTIQVWAGSDVGLAVLLEMDVKGAALIRVGVCGAAGERSREFAFSGDLRSLRTRATVFALDHLRRTLLRAL